MYNPFMAEPAVCYLCEGPFSAQPNRDHVIPSLLFEGELPQNMFTLPTCPGCNTGLSLDEEYFRMVVLPQSYDRSNTAKELWDGKCRRMLAKKTGFKKMLASKILRVQPSAPFFSSDGRFIGDGSVMMADGKRVSRVLTKMIRGLYWKHVGSLLGEAHIDSWYFDPRMQYEEGAALPEFWQFSREERIGNVLRYWWLVTHNEPRCSLWWMEFYNSVIFMSATDRKDPEGTESIPNQTPLDKKG